MKLALSASLIAAALVATGAAHAQVDPTHVRSWAAGCANCHGTDGKAAPGMIALAGSDKNEMLNKLLAFKSGTRAATIMHQLAKGYSDEQLAAIASWFSAQKR